MVKGFAKSAVYAYRATCFMIWHLGKRQFKTVDECAILQLVAALRRDLAQQDEHWFCATTIQTGVLRVFQPSPFLISIKIHIYIKTFNFSQVKEKELAVRKGSLGSFHNRNVRRLLDLF